jgi:hypothetical protein
LSFIDSIEIKWVIPAALAAAWSLKLSLSSTITEQLVGLSGIGSLLLLIALYQSTRRNFSLHWDEQAGVLAIVRAWSVEMYTTRLIASVPQGIDLQHSATRVLAAMHARYEEDGNGILEFHVCRPLRDGPSLVGFTACRKQIRTQSLRQQMESLGQQVHEDGMILESAMHASYPHTPIERAELERNLLIRSGGTDVFARE